MTLVRRLVLIVSIMVTGSLALAAAATAAAPLGTTAAAAHLGAPAAAPAPGGGKGGPLGPGEYTFTDTSASAIFGTPTPKGSIPQFIISVDRNVSSFRPDGGPNSVTKGTAVTIQISTPAINGYGCFSIDPSDFTVSKDQQQAALHTTLSVPCTGPKGGGFGLPPSIKVDLTWTGNGVLSTSRHSDNFECAGYSTSTDFLAHGAGVTASGSVTANSNTLLPQSPADSSNLQSTQTNTQISGVEKPACFALQFSA